ncbi:FUCL4-like protein [Mya arenaria]|uniref:FUCL4-like protein n=1 Tax=Mya arenaria TaxID=6604 RepID=A0ABY7EBC6_MYAAR|nr:FUCL4-like protein [Mya arenaria]
MATATSKTYLSSESGSIMTKWDDIPCGFKRRAVCQKIPEYNIALGKLTTVSSGEQGYKFIDDCADRNMDNGCCGLIPGPYPWWQLDLGIPFSIGSIVIHRRDVCPTEMRDFRLFISNVTGAKNVTDLIYTETSDRPQAIITVHFDTPITGRFVRIDIPEEDVHMALCEVQQTVSLTRRNGKDLLTTLKQASNARDGTLTYRMITITIMTHLLVVKTNTRLEITVAIQEERANLGATPLTRTFGGSTVEYRTVPVKIICIS